MEANPNIQDKIDRYITGLMSPEELAAFETEIRQDDEVRAAVELEQDLVAGIRSEGNRALKSKLKSMHAAGQGADKVVPIRKPGANRMWLAAALVLIVCLPAAYYFSGGVNNFSKSDLYSSYYERPDFSTTRGESKDPLTVAAEHYSKGQFEEAITALKEHRREQPENGKQGFYMGICLLEEDKYEEAIKEFQAVINNSDPFYTDLAMWYLALAYLKNDQKQHAKPLLETLSGDDAAGKLQKNSGKLLKEWE